MREVIEVAFNFWWVYVIALAAFAMAAWRFPGVRRYTAGWFTKEVTAPRWVAFLWGVRDVVLVVGAVTAAVLWFQAATRDEEADRNARIQACSAAYAATTAAWDAEVALQDQRSESFDRHAETLFSQLVAAAQADTDVDSASLEEYEEAQEDAEITTALAKQSAHKVRRMTRLRIGLARYSAESVELGNDFACPAIPDNLMVTPIEVGNL